MKKMLILMLVLGVVSVASAMQLQIYVNGSPPPPTNGIILQPSGTALLSISSPDGYSEGADVYFALVSNPSGTISGGVVHIPPAPDLSQMLGSEWAEAWTNTTDLGIYGQFMSSGTANGVAGIFVDEITFHCEGGQSALVSLYTTYDFGVYNLADQITITQIPEPATMLLLSLGGLLLRKRGK